MVFHCARNGTPQLLYGFQKGSCPCQKHSRWKYASGYAKKPKSRTTNVFEPSSTSGNAAKIIKPRKQAKRRGVSPSPAGPSVTGAAPASLMATCCCTRSTSKLPRPCGRSWVHSRNYALSKGRFWSRSDRIGLARGHWIATCGSFQRRPRTSSGK